MKKYKLIVDKLIKNKKQIATMESCTGGALASEITNVEGASNVLLFSAVTYSNEYKEKMGVDKEIIAKYSVYSENTAKEMAKNIAEFAHADYGVGITGKINTPDKANDYGRNDIVYVTIYDLQNNNYYNYNLKIKENVTRKENKEYVIDKIGDYLLEIV